MLFFDIDLKVIIEIGFAIGLIYHILLVLIGSSFPSLDQLFWMKKTIHVLNQQT